MSADTEALLATVREALWPESIGHEPRDVEKRDALAALDSLAAELERLRETWGDCEQELERVKAERDANEQAWIALSGTQVERAEQAEARLDKALAALREIEYEPLHTKMRERARAALAEIEGEA